ncbi:TniQ family protein [Cypionkella sp.]|uniref:TniQ family protein n=1 Tax=Cypionkella sp. TaxID=2811411 RepID=UPI00271824F4|nr:TniQ family protein [Cypionkella sp.]MDO8982359.1 TniQ family protein [Cypionkella sp.]MDP2050609.1 TniQ family protein [Cypionkella sp.]
MTPPGPLPFRPPPARDELLSSWIGRLARANHCSAEELCGYLGLGQGRVLERINNLGQVDWARLCSAVQRTQHEIAAMTLPDTVHHAVRYLSRHDFQHCPGCAEQTPGLALRHWRFAWSLTCETCGQSLAAKYPAGAVSDRLLARAARGAQVLETAVANNDLRRLRRMDLTLHVVSMLDVCRSASVISANERERLIALTAVDVGMTRPLLGAAIILRGNERAVRGLRRAFPQHGRVFERIRALTHYLDQRLPGRWETEHPTGQKTNGTSRPSASESALQAARQAISELGSEADRQALLARADAIWKRSSGIEH